MFAFLADWMLGPKPVEDDSEEGSTKREEEQRLSVASDLTVKDGLKMEMEKSGLLPGLHRPSIHPSSPVLLKSAFALSHPREKRISAHSVTFACPVSPYATSL